MLLSDMLLASPGPAEAWILSGQSDVQRRLLGQSRDIRTANFKAIHRRDLAAMFAMYDEYFFGGRCAAALAGRELRFRFAPRMTKSAGTTALYRDHRTAEESFEISIASSMLFDGFGDSDHRDVTVCGVECATRLDALQRVFEHELVHLLEHLCWRESNCSMARFQAIAGGWFLHRSHTHALITRRERAAASGIRPGVRVSFVFEGRRREGVVNRVTKRATVLVEDADGLRYSNGKRYLKYYIPLAGLTPE